MRRALTAAAVLTILLGVGAGLSACAGKAEAVTCDECGTALARKDVTMVGDRTLCAACAAKAAAAAPQEMLTCASCGMKMARSEMTEVDGRWLCSHCVPADAAADAGGGADHDRN